MTTHDYTRPKRCWGHDLSYTIDNKTGYLQATGWGTGVSEGDFILLTIPETGAETRYVIAEIKHYLDPIDMWKAELHYAPRQAPETINENPFASQPPLTLKEIKARRWLRWFSSRR